MKNTPWLPKLYQVTESIEIKYLAFSGDSWQIYKLTDHQNLLVVTAELTSLWIEKELLQSSIFHNVYIEGITYRYFVSPKKYTLAPLDYMYFNIDKISSLAFATSLRESRKIAPDVSFENAIYAEMYSRLLPQNAFPSQTDDSIVLGTWLSGGVAIPTHSIRRLQSLTPFFSLTDLEEIIAKSGIDIQTEHRPRKSSPKKTINPQPKGDRFSLPGASYLEMFFEQNVIDIVQHPEKYEPLGIQFPSPIILHGKPGTGKTYAVERLAEYLDWPIYYIDSQSIASSYIHQTPQKISEVFHKAFDSAPSIIIIDEMEAYLSKREFSHDHKVEETAEFLRLIPETPRNNVLVVGMTNLFDNIDPAILRTGRFDHKIEVLMPTADDIKAMLDSALENLPTEQDIFFDDVISYLVNKPRSDTTFVIKEAARLTAYKGKAKISQEEFEEAIKALMTASNEKTTNKIGFV